MAVKVISIDDTPITDELVTEFLRLNAADVQDATLAVCTNGAIERVENYTGRSIKEKVLELALDDFPAVEIKLPYGPVTSIESVKYTDADGVIQTIDVSDYYLDNYGDEWWLLPAYETDWPSPRAEANAVKVRYTSGYAEEALPDSLRAAILLCIQDLYDNREAQSAQSLTMNRTIMNLLNPYRIDLGV
jgi:uncharacterized phiE125 gp8 family phage protein